VLERDTGLEPATSSLGSRTYVESKSLARFCCEFLNLQRLAESAFLKSVAQSRHERDKHPLPQESNLLRIIRGKHRFEFNYVNAHSSGLVGVNRGVKKAHLPPLPCSFRILAQSPRSFRQVQRPVSTGRNWSRTSCAEAFRASAQVQRNRQIGRS
jgi:hypothetical protein